MKSKFVLAMAMSLASVSLTSTMFSPAVSAQELTINQALADAVASDFRRQSNVARDNYRHPAETLAFFDVKPEQTVVELWPGGGWYAEILAPYLADKGQYIAANFETQPKEDTRRSAYFKSAGEKFEKWVSDNKAIVGDVKFVTLNPPEKLSLGEDNSVDHVLTFRNLHNWATNDQLEGVFEAAYAVLKVGGSFGVVEHRANKGMEAKSGYMEQQQMIDLAKKVGFELVASSEINANPKDTKDYPKGVWTLPPNLRMGDEDKQKYIDIGESDRMTLKFLKAK
ncbi:class I SAM-dependent methyltransferase [Shewanella gaetbuli]